MPGGLDRAGGRAGCDPSPLGVPAPAWEGTDGVEEAAALLPSLRVSAGLRRGHSGPQATMEVWAIEPLEEEEESDFELEALEEEEHLLEEVEEEETVENDESEQEGAAVVAGHGDPLEQFGPVFWGLVHSLLHSFSYNDHALVWPPGPCPTVKHSSQPPSGPGEGPAPPQEQEDLAEGGEASQVPVPKSVLYFTKEASDYQYEESDEEVQEAEGEEEDSDKKPEEGPEKDLDPAEDSPGEPRLYLWPRM
ncbi:cancer/testis antigen family 47 member C1-like isoform X1 [Bubalus kerabau]|uniref:cancer/testis antigen family 47 member C1-like isoform X1 n=1 Tax=Bubalus carabanensis TaxID=3119969 RepID=UPI00244E5E3B|nr:cancer/testis antigen family 47 member C1-like isoform X1 [Bubalus carabanensis]XP_055420220.1 cancer/testis antigen family 47 member C1-like isoform X1 [Bubalus carabanensis]